MLGKRFFYIFRLRNCIPPSLTNSRRRYKLQIGLWKKLIIDYILFKLVKWIMLYKNKWRMSMPLHILNACHNSIILSFFIICWIWLTGFILTYYTSVFVIQPLWKWDLHLFPPGLAKQRTNEIVCKNRILPLALSSQIDNVILSLSIFSLRASPEIRPHL